MSDEIRIRVVCSADDCERTGSFFPENDAAALRDELEAAPWLCLYHDLGWRWHTRRADREAAQRRGVA